MDNPNLPDNQHGEDTESEFLDEGQARKVADKVSLQNREEVRARLEQLERDVRYETVGSAMCYVSVQPSDRVDYICPTCGARTAYDSFDAVGVKYLPKIRKKLGTLNALCEKIGSEYRFALDESPLCVKCSNRQSSGCAVLVCTAGTARTLSPLSTMFNDDDDISMLTCFFQGRLFYKLTPMRELVGKISELLGVEYERNGQNYDE